MSKNADGWQSEISHESHTIVGNLLDACFNVQRPGSADTSVIGCDDLGLPGEILDYRQPALGVTRQARYKHQRRTLAVNLIVKINAIDFCIRHLALVPRSGWLTWQLKGREGNGFGV
jgi:hypothetical protein